MKIKDYNSFFNFVLLLSRDMQLNAGPTSYVCFIYIRTLHKRSFHCTKCHLRAHKIDSDICSDYKRWENLPFHNVCFSIDDSSETASYLLED